ncbi:vancomycin high temperature exclusion protein [Streptomyces sp. NBC_00727]|uniref:SanA/YdcF family protein n=1 Tax=Streptomyces sp. NBC_00727 TaxID=2903675 RepID=UPI0038707D7F
MCRLGSRPARVRSLVLAPYIGQPTRSGGWSFALLRQASGPSPPRKPGRPRRFRVKVVLVTGDNSREEYDEPDAMRTFLVGKGVPDDRIVSDFAGFDTWDSCVRAKKIFGVDRAVLVSQGFHIRRAIALCREAGIDAYGVGVDAEHDVTWYYGGAREVFAAGKAALDALFEPDPHFLGPRERGVADALAAASR